MSYFYDPELESCLLACSYDWIDCIFDFQFLFSIMNDLENRTLIPDHISFDDALSRTTHLAIGAHPDDLEIFAYHGIATCYESDTQWFAGVTITDGGGCSRRGKYASYTDDQMKVLRRDEQNEAASMGRYSFQSQLGMSRAELQHESGEALVLSLVELMERTQPKVVYLHNPMDKHPTHLWVLRRSLEALRKLSPENQPEKVYGCEVWRDLDWLRDEDKLILAVDAYPDLAKELLEIYESQIAGGKDYAKATLGRRYANATFLNSHQSDGATSVTYAVDLSPLIRKQGVSLTEFVEMHTRRFMNDAVQGISAVASA